MTCIDNKVSVNVTLVVTADKVITPEKIAEDVYEYYKEGAAMVYLHVRDREGRLTPDMSSLEEVLVMTCRDLDIIIEVPTGGVSDLNIQKRCAPLYPEMVEACSPNVEPTNLGRDVYYDSVGDVECCVREILKQKKTSEVETFEIGHTWTMEQLMKKYDFVDPVLFSIVLGYEGEALATPQALAAMIQMISPNTMWGIIQAHRKDFSLLVGAVGMGVRTARAGSEDSNYLNPQTQVTSSAPLAKRTAKLFRAMDKEPTRPEEARVLLGTGG